MLCKNERCKAPLSDSHWGDGYCSRRCMTTADDYERDAAPLLDPSDPTGHAEICRNRDEVDAMLEAAAVHPLLPKALYLMRKTKKKSMRSIARSLGIPHTTLADAFARLKASTAFAYSSHGGMSPPIAKDHGKRLDAERMIQTGDAL